MKTQRYWSRWQTRWISFAEAEQEIERIRNNSMNNNQGTDADTDFQFRVRKIKNGMLVLHRGETTFCSSMASVKLAIKEALKNYERAYGSDPLCKKEA